MMSLGGLSEQRNWKRAPLAVPTSTCPTSPDKNEDVIPLSDSQRLKRGSVNCPCHAEIVVLLITGKSGLCLVASCSVDRAVIVTKLRKLRLNSAYSRDGRGLTRSEEHTSELQS